MDFTNAEIWGITLVSVLSVRRQVKQILHQLFRDRECLVFLSAGVEVEVEISFHYALDHGSYTTCAKDEHSSFHTQRVDFT